MGTEKQIFGTDIDIMYPEWRHRHRNKLEGNKTCIIIIYLLTAIGLTSGGSSYKHVHKHKLGI